jgi:predicted DNA-binding transcriptional regulator AlpA
MNLNKHDGPPAGNSPGAISSEHFLQANRVWARYGVSFMTINRWIKDERIAFPPPVYMGRLRFWKIADLEAWEAQQPRSRRAS